LKSENFIEDTEKKISISEKRKGRMSQKPSIAANLKPEQRKKLFIEMQSSEQSVTALANREGVSRKFLYQQQEKGNQALEKEFNQPKEDSEVLYWIPVTKKWIVQVILALIFICHSSYRGVVEFLACIFDYQVSVATVHNRVESVVAQAQKINQAQDLSGIKVGLKDEIFQSGRPVLTGVDAFSTYCYLLVAADHRDEDNWGWHLLEASERGLNPDYSIADAAKGLRAGHEAVWPGKPCHGDTFHILQAGEGLTNYLDRKAQGASSQREKVEEKLKKAKKKGEGNRWSRKLVLARLAEERAQKLAQEVSILFDWLRHDILALAGPDYPARSDLWDFLVVELKQREGDGKRIRSFRIALENQKEDLLAFAAVLDEKLTNISQQVQIPLYLVRKVCFLQGQNPQQTSYWATWNQLHSQIGTQFYRLMEAVEQAMKETPRASSLVENFNSRLRNYFFLRRQLGNNYLDLLRFFLNHRTFLRSEYPEREGKSPAELLTGESHPHWLELLGFNLFRRPAIVV
jgi:hypothetical protein